VKKDKKKLKINKGTIRQLTDATLEKEVRGGQQQENPLFYLTEPRA
jgi:hypothetical protein